MAAKPNFIWNTSARQARPIEGLHYGAVVAYDRSEKGLPRIDGEPHLGIVFETEFGRSSGKRVLKGLHVLTMSVHGSDENVPLFTSRTRMIPYDILTGQMSDLNKKNKYVGQFHLVYVPLSPENLGIEDGIRTVGTIAGTDWGEKFFMKAEGMPLDLLRSAANIDAYVARQLSTYRLSMQDWASNEKDTTTRLGSAILSAADYTVYTDPKPAASAKPSGEKKEKIKTPYFSSAVGMPQAKMAVLEQLENNPDNIDLLIKTDALRDSGLWRKLKELTNVDNMYYFWILSAEEVNTIQKEMRGEKIMRKFDFIRTLHHFSAHTPELEQEHLMRFYDTVIDGEAAAGFQKRKPELVNFIRDSIREGAVLEEIIRRCEEKASKTKTPQTMINDIPAAILAAGHLEYKAALTPAAPAPVVPESPAVPEVQAKFDVRLKDIFPVLHPGGEWNGVTKLRGGAHDDEENQPVADPKTGKKTKVLGTLRDAWTYMKDVSEDLNADKIAQTLQQVGSISPGAVTKTVAILNHLFDELNKVEKKDGKLKSRDSAVQVLIDRGAVFEAK